MSQRILFIGQAPSRETDGLPPFVGRAGKFLAELMCTTQDKMLADHDFINVLDRWPGKGPGGDKFPLTEARIAAREKEEYLRGRRTILLGSNVVRAFEISNFEYFKIYQVPDKETGNIKVPFLSVVPHPSGINRWYNKPENRLLVSKFLREVVLK